MDHVFWEIIARTLDITGKVLVAYMAIRVHHRVRHDHKIDKHVFADMKQEQILGFFGISLMLIAYLMKLFELLSA